MARRALFCTLPRFSWVLVLLSLAHLAAVDLRFHSIFDERSPQDSNTPVGGVAGNGSANFICNDPTTLTPDAYAASGADTLLLDTINHMGTRKSLRINQTSPGCGLHIVEGSIDTFIKATNKAQHPTFPSS
jgi:hypothetical protein